MANSNGHTKKCLMCGRCEPGTQPWGKLGRERLVVQSRFHYQHLNLFYTIVVKIIETATHYSI